MKTESEKILANGEVMTESGRVFYRPYQALLDAMPQDLVREMARRRLAEIQEVKSKRVQTSDNAGDK